MLKYKVSDSITIQRTWIVEAESEEKAIDQVDGLSAPGQAADTEEQIENTPYEAVEVPPTKYRMLYRPLMFATYPSDITTEWVELPQDGIIQAAFPGIPTSGHRFGVFTTDRPLTADELSSYQIEIVADCPACRDELHGEPVDDATIATMCEPCQAIARENEDEDEAAEAPIKRADAAATAYMSAHARRMNR